MLDMKIEFIGIVQNADFSLCNVKLTHDFRFDRMQDNDFINGIILELDPPGNRQHVSDITTLCNHKENMFYFVRNTFEADINPSSISHYLNARETLGICTAQYSSSTWGGKFGGKIDLSYLCKVFRLMSLFKEGNISMPLSYYYTNDGCRFVLFERGGFFPSLFQYPQNTIYSLSDSEQDELQRFLKQDNSDLFSDKVVKLAFDHFEFSYQTENLGQSFLSLMICIEMIYSPDGRNELKNRVSRGVAILVGNSPEEAIEIFKNMKDLYDKRSKLVHTGITVEECDLLLLRYYARETLKRVVSQGIGRDLNHFRRELENHGLGEKPFRFK